MNKIVSLFAQFIPITLVFLLLSFSKSFAVFSYSILGKILALGIIVFYTYLDTILGLFVCAIVVLYYQSDFFENMLNIDDVLEDIQEYDSAPSNIDSVDDGVYLNQPYKNSRRRERMTLKTVQSDLIDKFRKDNCSSVSKNGKLGSVLKYKDMTVKSDYAEHVFPELEFKNGPCNPCNKSCGFSIIESKITTEAKMIPISTSQ